MKLPQIGPAFLVTAAFIGPGTVITTSLAGANFGYALLWALLFSAIATIVLQEMSARLGIVTQQGLGENIRDQLRNPLARILGVLLVVSAIAIGNAAYQGGNISGASLGLSGIVGKDIPYFVWPIVIGVTAFALLWTGSYKLIEKSLISLVALMSISFIATMLITAPDISLIFKGLFVPHIPDGATLTVIALIGTTVVPYNLFLHASSVKEKWTSASQLSLARKDLYISVPIGALISMAILSTAATAFFGHQINIQSAADLAPALEPLFGSFSGILMAIGLFAAGISSAVTAPLAAAFALSGMLGISSKKTDAQSILQTNSFKIIWISILLLGVIVATSGYRPINIIWFAQVANGILLPVITCFLLWVMNTKKLGEHKNKLVQNLLGGVVLMTTIGLSARSLGSAFGLL